MRLRQACCEVLAVFLTGGFGLASRADDKPEAGPALHRATWLAIHGEERRVGFTRLGPELTGITITNHVSLELAARNQILLNGSGVAAGDYDGDGLCDLYFCTLTNGNHLFRNLGGWRFTETTTAAGVRCEGQWSTGTAFADLDGDGKLDLLVNAIGGGTRHFRNLGGGRFEERKDSGFKSELGAHSLAVADVDGDGDLDVYVANYRTSTVRDNPVSVRLRQVNGEFVVPAPYEDRFLVQVRGPGQGSLIELGEPDVLYLNDGHGRFRAESWVDGRFRDEHGQPLRRAPLDWGLSVMFRDLNGDGAPDLYVCNDFASPDRIWMNDGRGQFAALPPEAMRHTSWASMAVDGADIDRDGHVDLFVADMLSPDGIRRQVQRGNAERGVQPEDARNDRPQYPRNTLFRNRGNTTYAEIAFLAGLEASDWTWGSVFLDVDLDGYEDLLVGNGHLFDMQDLDAVDRIGRSRSQNPRVGNQVLLTNFPPLLTKNLAFRNQGQLHFEELGAAWGFDRSGITHGVILADLDNDGDLDVVTSDLDQAAGLYRNDSSAPRVAVRLRGATPNTQGIGAHIRLVAPRLTQSQEMVAGGRYLSCDQAQRTFAFIAGQNEPARLEILWRSGRRSQVDAVQPNQLYEVTEPRDGAVGRRGNDASPAAFQFVDASALLGHRHEERSGDESAGQPLLPRQVSGGGPGVAAVDVNGDGWDDVAVTGSAPQPAIVLTNDLRGGFARDEHFSTASGGPAQNVTVLSWATATNNARLLLAQSGPSRLLSAAGLGPGKWEAVAVGNLPPAIGAMALGDVDADGDLDLFVGGSFAPGRYPEPVSSFLLRNDLGRWNVNPEDQALTTGGIVNSATFADLDNDGWPELLLACEWSPVRIFWNQHGKFVERTTALGLNGYRGWWNGITVADLDNDGVVEIVATGWGRNHRWQRNLPQTIRLYAGELAGDGRWLTVEAWRPTSTSEYFPWRDFRTLAGQFPSLRGRFSRHADYARANVGALLGEGIQRSAFVEANMLDSLVFTVRNDRANFQPLPIEAQFSAAFGAVVADFDADGNEDLFFGQNFFAVDGDSSRLDAGCGLLLRGDGRGRLAPVPGFAAGLVLPGEQRGVAAADFDHDGRTDLVVGQVNGDLKLFRNRSAAAGLRVGLRGPAGNPAGIGAALRVKYPGSWGPARQVLAGSGYRSQSSAVQVLGLKPGALGVEVLWPGGRRQFAKLQVDQHEIVIRWEEPP